MFLMIKTVSKVIRFHIRLESNADVSRHTQLIESIDYYLCLHNSLLTMCVAKRINSNILLVQINCPIDMIL